MILLLIALAAVAYLILNQNSASQLVAQVETVVTGNLTAAQIATVAAAAGFEGDDLMTAVAIAFAESSGNPAAEGDYGNPIPGKYNAIGLWQINVGENPGYANENLKDPQTNANAAFSLFQLLGFKAWTTFNNGAYQSYTQTAAQGVADAGISS